MKKMLLIFIALFTINSFAQDFFTVPFINFQIATSHPLEKLEVTLKYPEGLLKRFTPEGAKITKKKVTINNVSFNATKSYLFISQTVYVSGTLDSKENNAICTKNEVGYEMNFNFEGSDSLVVDNIDRIEVKLCVKEITNNLISGNLRAKLIKSKNFSNIIGSFAKEIIEAQVNPLLKALHDDVLSQH
jgi:hypothetical protein